MAWARGGARSGRLRIFEGDPAAIDMGLSGAEYRELCAAVGCIQHLARITDDGSAGDSETLNIGGMREVLELGGACARLESVVVHSSVSVSGDRVGSVAESELEAGQRFPVRAAASLARAELMARRCMPRLPIVVIRAGQIVAADNDPAIEVLTGLYLLIILVLYSAQDLSPLLGAFADMPLNVVPVDFLVRAADRLGREPNARGHTLHLTDPAPMNVRQVVSRCMKIRAAVRQGGLPLPRSMLFGAGTLGSGLQAILQRPRAFIDTTFRNVRYGTDVADRLLGASGLSCPALETYLEQVVKQVAHVVASAGPISASAAS